VIRTIKLVALFAALSLAAGACADPVAPIAAPDDASTLDCDPRENGSGNLVDCVCRQNGSGSITCS
jgi:hypothetical protein